MMLDAGFSVNLGTLIVVAVILVIIYLALRILGKV